MPGVSRLLPWLSQREGSLTFGVDFLEIKTHHSRDLPQDPTQVIAHGSGWRRSERKCKFCPRGTTDFGVLATNLSVLQLMFKLTKQDTYGSINLKIPIQLCVLCTVKSMLLWVSCLVRFQVSVNSQGANACTVEQMIFQSSHLQQGMEEEWGSYQWEPEAQNAQHHIPTVWTSLTGEVWVL